MVKNILNSTTAEFFSKSGANANQTLTFALGSARASELGGIATATTAE